MAKMAVKLLQRGRKHTGVYIFLGGSSVLPLMPVAELSVLQSGVAFFTFTLRRECP